MTYLRSISLALAIAAASTLVGCSTAPMMPMGAAPPSGAHEMARMDGQMKTMGVMHEKMMSAKTPEERNKLMAEHMKTMQEGMAMMGNTSGASMGDMKGMPGTAGDMAVHHQMMEKRMEMMHMMMKMMMDRMSAVPVQ